MVSLARTAAAARAYFIIYVGHILDVVHVVPKIVSQDASNDILCEVVPVWFSVCAHGEAGGEFTSHDRGEMHRIRSVHNCTSPLVYPLSV